MTEPGLVTILKVRVENLQSPGPGGWGSRRLKVKFRAETAAVETLPKQPNHDGSIEWTEPLEMNVHDTEARLDATVVSRSGDRGPWSLVPDGRFEGFPVKECPPVWVQVSETGLIFRAELTTFINGGAEGALPLSSGVEEHEGRQYFPASAGSDTHTGVLQQAQRRTSAAEPSTPGPSWRPAAGAAAGAVPVSRLGHSALPVSTAVPVAAAAAAPETAHAAGSARGGSLRPAGSARRHSAVVQRSSSGGYLTRDGSVPGRSRDSSFSSFRLARGSSRSLGQSQGESYSSQDSGQPPLPSPVGTRSVSRLMDDNFRLEEDDVSRGIPPSAVPSERVWGGPALQRVPIDDSLQVDDSVRSGRLDSTGSAQREEPSIELSPAFDAGDATAPPAYGAGDSPAPPPLRQGRFRRFPQKRAKKPPGEPNTGDGLKASGFRTFLPSWYRSKGASASSQAQVAASAAGVLPGAPEVTVGESKTSTPPPDTDATVRLSWERSSVTRGRRAGPPSGRTLLRRSAPLQGAAAPAREEPDVASPRSPGAMTATMSAVVPVPPAPSAPPLFEGGEHGYDIPLPPDGATIPSPSSTVRPQGAGVQPDTARARTPPPSYDDVYASHYDTFAREPFGEQSQLAQQAARRQVAQQQQQLAAQQQAQQEFVSENQTLMVEPPIYDAPHALGPRFEDAAAWENVENFGAIPAGSTVPPSAVPGPDTSEGRTFYSEGIMLQEEELLDVTERKESGAGEEVSQPRPRRTTPAVELPGRIRASTKTLKRRDRAQSFEVEDEEAALQHEGKGTLGESPAYDHPGALGSRVDDEDTWEHEEGYSAMPANDTAHGIADGPNGFTPRAIDEEDIIPRGKRIEGRRRRGEELLATVRQLKTHPPRVTSVPRSVSVRTVEPAPTRAIQPVGRLEDREIRDPVCFSCFSPPSVWAEHTFELHVLAFLPQLRDEVLESARSKGEVEAGLPGGMSILRGKEVTVKLDLPDHIFKTLRPEGSGSSHPPSVRDFKWNGNVETAGFEVECLQHAPVGDAPCGAHIIEGSQVTRLSFVIKVVDAGDAWAYGDMKAEPLDTKMEQVEANVAVIDPGELEISNVVIGRGVQGKTFKGRWRGKDVAIKRLEQSSAPSSSVSGLRHEATILSLLGHHPNIVEFYGLSSRGGGNGDEGLDVVTKFEEGGSLQAALGIEGIGDTRTNGGRWTAGSGGKFSGYHRTAWARDMARGLANSHSVGVVHNDVACRNALLSSTEIGAPVLLCDFGMSRMLRGDGVERASLIDVQGTQDKWPVRQMPKESLIFPYSLSPSSDTWMYGTMLYEIFEGKKPFCGISSKEVKALIIEGKTLDTPVLLKEQGLEDVYRSCLEVDWTKRPKMEQVVEQVVEVLPH